MLRLAEASLAGSAQQGVRHTVLRQLVADIGESCNLTTLAGVEVVWLDRIESAFPLQFKLRPGTRVPLHCSASGKLILAHMSPAQRTQLLDGLPLQSYTATTLTTGCAQGRVCAHPQGWLFGGCRGVCGRTGLRGRARVQP
jgi:DNA-binding IclR family transcriptional regulator